MRSVKIGITTCKTIRDYRLKLKIFIPYDLVIPFLSRYPMEMCVDVHQNTCVRMTIAALFKTAPN